MFCRKSFAVSAALVLCGLGLTGCSSAGGCGQAISIAPQARVDVEPWLAAHPGTVVRVCLDGNCAASTGLTETSGALIVAVRGAQPSDMVSSTPRRMLDVTAKALNGSAVVMTRTASAALTTDECGQRLVRLRLAADGALGR